MLNKVMSLQTKPLSDKIVYASIMQIIIFFFIATQSYLAHTESSSRPTVTDRQNASDRHNKAASANTAI